MGADARGDETPIRVVMTDELREVIVRAVTQERDRARRRAPNVTKELSGVNLFEVTDRDLTMVLEVLNQNDVTMTAHLWNQVSWALSERVRVADYWHDQVQERRLDIVDRIEDALGLGQSVVRLDS